MDVVPLTPTVVDCVTFDRAPLGRRGYNEDQVDDFLDRVQATLAGKDNLTAQNVRDVVFDPAAFIRRGYHEDQVDEFLDLVVEELDRRAGNPRQAPRTGAPAPRTGSPTAPVPPVPFPTHLRQTPPPGATEQTAPMLFSLPPSMPSPSTQPMKREEQAASGPPESTLPAPTDSSAPSEPVVHTPTAHVPTDAPLTNGKSAAPPTNGTSVAAPATISEQAEATPSTEAKDKTEPSPQTAPPSSAPRQPAAPSSASQAPAAEPVRSPEADPSGTSSEPSPAEPAQASATTTTAPNTPSTPTAADPPTIQTTPAATTAIPSTPAATEPPGTQGDLAAAPSASETPQQSASSKAREFEPEAWRDSDHLALPLPPAPPGERGYRPGDVERLMKLLAAMLADPSSPGPDELANLKLSRTFFVGQGYHTGAVDTLRQAWLDELTRRAL